MDSAMNVTAPSPITAEVNRGRGRIPLAGVRLGADSRAHLAATAVRFMPASVAETTLVWAPIGSSAETWQPTPVYANFPGNVAGGG